LPIFTYAARQRLARAAPSPGIRRLISAFCFPHFCFAACAAMSKNQAPGDRPAPKNSLPFQLFSFSAFQLLPQALHPPQTLHPFR